MRPAALRIEEVRASAVQLDTIAQADKLEGNYFFSAQSVCYSVRLSLEVAA